LPQPNKVGLKIVERYYSDISPIFSSNAC